MHASRSSSPKNSPNKASTVKACLPIYRLGPYPVMQEDITTLYDALSSASARKLAECFFRAEVSAGSAKALDGGETGKNFSRSNIKGASETAEFGAVLRKTKSMLSLMERIGPSPGAFPDIVVMPWEPSDSSLPAMLSWQKALGLRVVLPSFLSDDERHALLANMLRKMARPSLT